MTQRILAFFTDSGVPKTGLSPTIIIRDLTAGTVVVNGEAMTEVGSGFYEYSFTSYDIDSDYAFRSDGTATLANAERYVFGSNESYVDDIWDAQIADHQVVGSLASEIRASHGTALGGAANGLTKEQAEYIAEQVWKVILENETTAREVLLSRSDFDALKDKVLLKTDIEFPKIINYANDLEDIKSALVKISKEVLNFSTHNKKSLLDSVASLSSQIKGLNTYFESLPDKNELNNKLINSVVEGVAKNFNLLKESMDKANISTDNVGGVIKEFKEDVSGSTKEYIESINNLRSSALILFELVNQMKEINPQMAVLKAALVQMSQMKYDLMMNMTLRK